MASNLVIVAIPSEDDYVWKISSEKVPHMTICFLGEASSNPNVSKIQEFLEHAVNIWEQGPFGLDVEERGELGVDNADVLFFRKGWATKKLEDFRAQLLLNDAISRAALVNNQYPVWTPHLTLGYPATPAKKDTRDYPGIDWVRFDRIALWTGDYSGPEFKLKYKYEWDTEVMPMAMSAVEEVLSHHGVKGMKWGRRSKSSAPTQVSVRESIDKHGKTQLKTSGGENRVAHPHAVNARVVKQVLKKSGTHALSNDELSSLATRLNLEKSVTALAKKPPSKTKKWVTGFLAKEGKTLAEGMVKDAAAGQVKKMLAGK